MNARHLLFKTSRFNLSEIKENFINPCCLGEDLAQWLRKKLVEEGVNVRTPGQEDWGWYLRLRYGRESYLLAIGTSGNEEVRAGKEGEWRIIVKKNPSIRRLLLNRARMTDDDPIAAKIRWILRQERDFRDIRTEPDPSEHRQSDSTAIRR